MVLDDGTVALRILLSAVLGGALGFERELRDRPAGFRTHILVSLGACLFTLAGAFAFDEFGSRTDVVGVDITRIASQIVVGIGFLGGGTILRHGGTVKGLTTAANLWVTAAVGLAVGLGFYVGALLTSVVVVASLTGLRPIEKRFMRSSPEGKDADD